jgi:RNase P protein component
MLPKKERLSTKQFDEVMLKGRVTHSPLFVFRHLLGQKSTRISATSSKKVNKTAVGRVRMRRNIYSGLGALMPMIVVGVHGIVFAKDAAVKVTPESIEKGLREVFVKAGVIQ